MQFIPPLVQKSYRSYEHPAPNAQQQPPVHSHAPATPHHNKPQPFYSSSTRKGSPSPEMLSTAANRVSTLPCWVCSPVMLSLTSSQGCKWKKEILPSFLPQHLLMVEENSPLISLASYTSSALPHLLPTLAQLLLRPWAPGSHTALASWSHH